VLVERRSHRQVAESLGLARDTVAKAVASGSPPRYERALAGSKLDPFKEWICEQSRSDPSITSAGDGESDGFAWLHRDGGNSTQRRNRWKTGC
jgi:hypothetical protein